MNSLLLKLYEEVKYDMVSFFDHLGYSDNLIRSTVGASDGDMYGRTMSKITGDSRNFGRPKYWKEIWKIRHGKMDYNL